MRKAAALIIAVLVLAHAACGPGGDAVNRGIFAHSRLDYVEGQDGVSSIQFDKDITLWTFADTIIPLKSSGNKSSSTMISNSIAWTERITAANCGNIRFNYFMESGRVAQFIKNRKGENPLKNRLWALDGVRTGNGVYVYYAHVYVPDPSKFLDFSIKYTGLAKWDVKDGWKPGDGFEFRRGAVLFPEGYPVFGAAATLRDGYVYVAGHSKRGNAFPVSIARVKEADIENPHAYEFLDASGGWTSDYGRCGYFSGDVAGECSLSYNSYYKCWDMFYARMFTGEIVHVQFGDFGELPGVSGRVIYRAKKPGNGKMWPYSAKEIFSEGGKTFIIYIDPEKYQPVLLEYKR